MARKLNDWVSGFLEYTYNTEPPRLFREWTAISVIASCLQRKCFLDWGGKKFPNMYVVLTSPSGQARKGTALAPGLELLLDLGVPLAADIITREALFRYMAEMCSTYIEPITNRVIMHSSVTVFSQELAVFLGYKNPDLILDLTDLYDNTRPVWTYRTKNQGVDEIMGAWVNIIGATTPDLIQRLLPPEALGGGLLARIIFVYEDRKGKVVSVPIKTAAEEALYLTLRDDLDMIQRMGGEFKVTDDFVDRWVEWYPQQEDNPPFNDKRFNAYFSRRPVHILKLSMILSASSREDMIINASILNRAVNLLERTEVRMSRAFGGYGMVDSAMVLDSIKEYLQARSECSMKELLDEFYHIADRDTIFKSILTLEEMGHCKLERLERKQWKVTTTKNGSFNS